MKTDLMIVGAQKAATSTLFEMLRRTGRVVCSSPKEPQFFSTCADWRKELPRYHAMFERRAGAIYCEASTSYTFYPHRNLEIWNDIHDYNKNVGIIYVVRNPLDRIVSHYKHSFRRGYTKASLEKFVLNYPLALSISRYYEQISPFVERFGASQVLLLEYDDITGRSPQMLERLARFTGIGLEELERLEPIHHNASETVAPHRFGLAFRAIDRVHPGAARALVKAFGPTLDREPAFSPALARAILRMLRGDIDRLETLMEKDLSEWCRPLRAGSHAGDLPQGKPS